MLNSAARWLATTAARFPERIGVEDEWGTMTWRELETAVERVSTAMLELGVERNQPVLVYLPKSRESVATFLAALYAGCPYAPVDYAIPMERLARTLENLRPALVVTDEAGMEKLGGLAEARGQTLAQFALSWVLSAPGVTSVLVGASSAAQLRENVACLAAAPLSQEEREAAAALLG